MENLARKISTFIHHNSSKTPQVVDTTMDATNELLVEGKKIGNKLYDKGLNKAHVMEDHIQDYSEMALKTVKKHPLTSVLVVASLGFLLSVIFRK